MKTFQCLLNDGFLDRDSQTTQRSDVLVFVWFESFVLQKPKRIRTRTRCT
ncbi:hypothetical protein RRSWK_03906 [Rhodopirellula sp. SWK7]|nr:hypothetical protein RRSWK_03906 [Rhodopirellula sp. SWK7]